MRAILWHDSVSMSDSKRPEMDGTAEPRISYAIARLHQLVFAAVSERGGPARADRASVHDAERSQPPRRAALELAARAAVVHDRASRCTRSSTVWSRKA